MASTNRSNLATLILSIISSVYGDRVWYNDMGIHSIAQDYGSHNIFILNGTTVTLENGWRVAAPESSSDGEDAIRVDDATFYGIKGSIHGGLGYGGSGITISTTRDSEYSPGTATFEAGFEVYGGDATREFTTKGGNAVQVLQSGSIIVINGGKYVPGAGCTIETCGVATDDGVALQVIQGKAVVKGGTYEGMFYNIEGDIEVHGCVVYDEGSQMIVGVLTDGSDINVFYGQPGGQSRLPVIMYHPDACPKEGAPESTTPMSNQGLKLTISVVSFFIYVRVALLMFSL
jgi:hypothetical protein